MINFHIIGTGACGFLRMHYYLHDIIDLNYKGGRGLIVLNIGMMIVDYNGTLNP